MIYVLYFSEYDSYKLCAVLSGPYDADLQQLRNQFYAEFGIEDRGSSSFKYRTPRKHPRRLDRAVQLKAHRQAVKKILDANLPTSDRWRRDTNLDLFVPALVAWLIRHHDFQLIPAANYDIGGSMTQQVLQQPA